MIKSFNEFIREFIENHDNVLDAKMSELKDLIDSVSTNGQNIIYEWQNKSDHELVINFTFEGLIVRYEFDIDSLFVAKFVEDKVDFKQNVSSIDEGLDIIEKDIHMILGINESYYIGQWPNSITEEDLSTITPNLLKCQRFFSKFYEEDLLNYSKRFDNLLSMYHDKIRQFIIETFLYSNPNSENASEEIILFGDDLKYDFNIEPNQLLDAVYKTLDYCSKFVGFQLLEKAKTRGERYKGKHIPAKYLTRKKKAMKKEIEEFRGKKVYKKDWEADYDKRTGKRVKTKKSAATKAYQRMFGDK